ncbi:unnamed protein product [Brassicogethes aeneus]|uniref:BZIP domain-containing protein n=1 Tax=Brassicogethes aeneus TaxID=1431903 RepID=A0A9P0BEM0_BRAAE|nr:unnamed protein product [Brassicogethes aeneus]
MVLDLSSKSMAMTETYQTSAQMDHEDVLDLCVKKLNTGGFSYENIKEENHMDIQSNSSSPTHSMCSVKSDLYENNNNNNNNQTLNVDLSSMISSKPTRPFKAFPKDPVSVAMSLSVPNPLFPNSTTQEYNEFRNKMMSQVQKNGTNKNMRRNSQSNTQNPDPTYWEKRKKNNEAAKRSRDARRAKEDEIAVRCAFLERENLNLKFKLASVENERKRLQSLLYNS